MQTLIRLATLGDIDTLFAIRTSVVQNHLSREQMSDLGLGWSKVDQVDGDDVRYQKSRAP